MSQIVTNTTNLRARATRLKTAGEDFKNQALSPIDDESTISANLNTRDAFEQAKQSHVSVGSGLIKSARQIDAIGEDFFRVDISGANILAVHTIS